MDDPSDIDKSIYTGIGPANSNADTVHRKHGLVARTCASLRLDIASAIDGKTWLLLPDGFRDQSCGATYPLPTSRAELQKLVVIPLPEHIKVDAGCIYVRRALKEFTKRNMKRSSAVLDIQRKQQQVTTLKDHMQERSREFTAAARAAVDEVRAEASKAIASLNDLFALGREGLGGIMKAHLAGDAWQGEKVSTDQFMGCFRMVSQAVKGLGLPSEQRDKARDAVMEEVAKSIEATKSAISGSTDDEVQH